MTSDDALREMREKPPITSDIRMAHYMGELSVLMRTWADAIEADLKALREEAVMWKRRADLAAQMFREQEAELEALREKVAMYEGQTQFRCQ